MPFALVIRQNPPSFNRGRNEAFQNALRNEARRRFAGQATLTGNLYARILWFHRQPTNKDVDNIIKNILDALQNVVFENDVAVTQCLACKINMGTTYAIEDRGAPVRMLEELLPLLAPGGPANVLYVEVDVVADNRVVLGPIDGGMA